MENKGETMTRQDLLCFSEDESEWNSDHERELEYLQANEKLEQKRLELCSKVEALSKENGQLKARLRGQRKDEGPFRSMTSKLASELRDKKTENEQLKKQLEQNQVHDEVFDDLHAMTHSIAAIVEDGDTPETKQMVEIMNQFQNRLKSLEEELAKARQQPDVQRTSTNWTTTVDVTSTVAVSTTSVYTGEVEEGRTSNINGEVDAARRLGTGIVVSAPISQTTLVNSDSRPFLVSEGGPSVPLSLSPRIPLKDIKQSMETDSQNSEEESDEESENGDPTLLEFDGENLVERATSSQEEIPRGIRTKVNLESLLFPAEVQVSPVEMTLIKRWDHNDQKQMVSDSMTNHIPIHQFVESVAHTVNEMRRMYFLKLGQQKDEEQRLAEANDRVDKLTKEVAVLQKIVRKRDEKILDLDDMKDKYLKLQKEHDKCNKKDDQQKSTKEDLDQLKKELTLVKGREGKYYKSQFEFREMVKKLSEELQELLPTREDYDDIMDNARKVAEEQYKKNKRGNVKTRIT